MEKSYDTGPVTGMMKSMLALETFAAKHRKVFGTLTPREQEVLALVAQGKSNPEIAETLSITRVTVQNHRARIRDKLGIASDGDYFKWALAFEIIAF